MVLNIKKPENVNHFAKQISNRILKIKQDNKNKILSDGKRFFGKRSFYKCFSN